MVPLYFFLDGRSVISSNGKPLLSQMRSFPMLDRNPTDLVEQIPEYSGFAICILEDEGNQLQIIKKSFGPQIQDILNQVFIDWLNGKGKKPVSWKTLIQCLQSSGYKELVRNMKAVLSMCYNHIYLGVAITLL